MSKEVTWKVFEEEKGRRDWVNIMHPFVGTPLFEHATDYITELEDGSRVMVRKRDNHVYRNNTENHVASEEVVEDLRKKAAKKMRDKRRRKSMILY